LFAGGPAVPISARQPPAISRTTYETLRTPRWLRGKNTRLEFFSSSRRICVVLFKKENVMSASGTISEILDHKNPSVWSVSPETTVFDAIQMMADKNIGALLVMDGEKLVGIMSERDYTRKVALKGKASKQTAVREIITGQVISVTPSHTVEDCMRLMTSHRIRHLPVLDHGRVSGIISIGDLVNWIISSQTSTIHQLQTYIAGYPG
jgi:CBS domain-containing protein